MNLLLNISIISLATQLLSHSSFLNKANSFSHADTSIHSCIFNKFLQPMFFSTQINQKLSLSSSSFTSFLETALVVTQKDFSFDSKTFYNQISNLKDISEPISICNCRFVSIFTESSDGGAILCFSDLIVKNSIFLNCQCAHQGGAISAFSKLIVSNSEFSIISATSSGAVFSDSRNKDDIFFIDVSLTQCSSSFSQSQINRLSKSNFVFASSNLSHCKSSGFYGGIVTEQSNNSVSFSYFLNNRGADFNTGFSALNALFVAIESSYFVNLSRTNPPGYAAVSVFIDNNLNNDKSYISNCVFRNLKKGPSIGTLGIHSVRIENCCFYHAENIEKKSYNSKYINCKFMQLCDPPVQKRRYPNENRGNEQVLKNFDDDDQFYFHIMYIFGPISQAVVLAVVFIIIMLVKSK